VILTLLLQYWPEQLGSGDRLHDLDPPVPFELTQGPSKVDVFLVKAAYLTGGGRNVFYLAHDHVAASSATYFLYVTIALLVSGVSLVMRVSFVMCEHCEAVPVELPCAIFS